MKKKLFSTIALFFCFFISVQATSEFPKSGNDVPTYFIAAPNMEEIRTQDALNDRQGKLYRIGVASFVNITTENSGLWTKLPSGDKQWQLIVNSPGAEALSFVFKTFKLSHGSTFWVETTSGKKVSEVLTSVDMLEDFQQHIALCFGDELVLTLVEKEFVTPSEINIGRVFYDYRSTGNPIKSKFGLGDAEDCQINVNCSEGTNYQDEKRGVARILITDGGGQGLCTGSLINNQAQDCKPLFLTALHCGVSTSTSDMNLWRFYFGFEAPSCTSPTSEGTLSSNYINSCIRLADSADNGGSSGSDFLLVQLGTVANETTTINKLISPNFNAYWNGWDANTTATTGGVGIHHPSGDIKKIATFTGTTTSSSWGSVSGTHWRLTWSTTANGIGTTEGGSSGSPLFKYNNGDSRIVGTLTGGGSCCIANGCGSTGTGPTQPDYYGKMSYHWQSNGSTSIKRIKTYLDPNNTGVLTLGGSSNPCNFVGINELSNSISDIKLFPNPTTDKLSVDLTSQSGKVTIEIYDMTGKLIATSVQTAGSIIDLDMTEMNKGIYNVHIKSIDLNFVQRISKM